jgi:3',5'-cyclic AMP phosphodiesterase CpdA
LTGFWKDGRIDRRQCVRIRRSFADADEPVRVLVAHHPFIEPPGGHAHGIVHGATDALAAIQDSGVSLVLSGHLHMAYHADLRVRHPLLTRPIINLVAGSATSTRRRDPCNSFNIVEVRGEALHFRIVDLREGRWQTR